MVVREPGTGRKMPAALVHAIEGGELTETQLRELIAFEAAQLDLTFDEAVQCAREGTLPKGALGTDLELLILYLLPA